MTINKEKFNPYTNLKGFIMANHASAKKRIRRNAKMEIVNKIRKNRVRSFIKKVEIAIDKSDKALAEEALKIAQPEMHRSVSKGIFKKNTMSRKLSEFKKFLFK